MWRIVQILGQSLMVYGDMPLPIEVIVIVH